MFNDRVKTINLGKLPAGSKDGYWVSNVNDAKLQEIADAFKLKLNTVTPGSEWYLYKNDEHKTTGIYVTFVNNIFKMYLFREGAVSDNGDKDNNSRNYNSGTVCVKNDDQYRPLSRLARIRYIEGMDGSFILWTTGYESNNSEYYENSSRPIILSNVTNIYDKTKDFCFFGVTPDSYDAIYTVLASGNALKNNVLHSDKVELSSSETVTYLIPLLVYFGTAFYVFDDIFLRIVGRSDGTYYFTLENQDYVHYANARSKVVMAIPSEE